MNLTHITHYIWCLPLSQISFLSSVLSDVCLLDIPKHFCFPDDILPFPVCMPAKLLQSCLTLCDSVDCSPPGSSVHGIPQARKLEWVAISSSRGPSSGDLPDPGIKPVTWAPNQLIRCSQEGGRNAPGLTRSISPHFRLARAVFQGRNCPGNALYLEMTLNLE